jgi:asparagine synthase (glutamine-hydrolysing)
MISNCGRYTIVFNGEIYNYRELKNQVDYSFKTSSDTEVLVALFIKYKENMLSMLNGMFSIAIYDNYTNELFLARDRFGIKPLYYFRNKNVLIFSSELRGLVKSELFSKKLNLDVLAEYLEYQTTIGSQTLLKDVFVFPPASFIVIKEASLTSDLVFNKYWDSTNYLGSNRNLNKHDAESLLFDRMDKAVDYNNISDVELGVFLSGGIDSSILTAMFSMKKENLKTFNVSFDSIQYSESDHARLISKTFGTNHYEYIVNSRDLINDIEGIFRKFDVPSGDGMNTYLVSKEFAKSGLKVAISGLGADELFGGYPSFERLKTLDRCKNFFQMNLELRKLIALFFNYLSSNEKGKIVDILSIDKFDIEELYCILRKNILDKDFTLAYQSTSGNKKRCHKTLIDSNYLHSSISNLEFKYFMTPLLLRDSDQMSMLNSIELRVPFLDHNLVESVLSLDDNVKFLSNKKLLIDSSMVNLPKSIYKRKKMGFSLPWKSWLTNDLKYLLDESFQKLDEMDIFQAGWLSKQKEQYLAGKINDSRIISIISLYYWISENEVMVS